jgi:hypothetical protein
MEAGANLKRAGAGIVPRDAAIDLSPFAMPGYPNRELPGREISL